MKSRLQIGALLGASVLLFSLPTFAAAAEDAAELPTIEVIGSREAWSGPPPVTPVAEVTPSQFAAVNAFNSEDLIKYVPNLNVRKRYIGDNNALLNIRSTHSMQSARSVVMVDGVLVSNFLGSSYTYAPRWGVAAPDEIESMEVLYGPYSARLPGNSLGGAVKIVTRDPQNFEMHGETLAFSQHFDYYATDANYAGTRAYAAVGNRFNGGTSVRFNYNRLRNTGQPQTFSFLRTGGTGATPVTGAVPDAGQAGPAFGAASAVDMLNDVLNLRVTQDFGSGWRSELRATYWQNTEETLAPGTYLRDANGQAVYEGNVQFNGINYVASGLNLGTSLHNDALVGVRLLGNVAGWALESAVSLYDIQKNESRSSGNYAGGVSNGSGTLTRLPVSGWRNAEVALSRSVGAHAISYGVWADLYVSEQKQLNLTHWRNDDDGTLANGTDGATRQLAAWGEDRWTMTDTLSFTLGLRYEDWSTYDGATRRATANGVVEQRYAGRHEGDWSPKASASYVFTDGLSSTLSYGRAYRHPTVGELFQGSLDSQGNFNPASFDPRLRTEVADDANLAFQFDTADHHVTLNLFQARVDDTIFRQTGISPVNGAVTTSYLNIDAMRNSGAELAYANRGLWLRGLDVDLNLAYNDAKILKDRPTPAAKGRQLPRVPHLRSNASLRYRPTERWSVFTGWRYSSTPYTNLTDGQRFDTFGYTTGYSVVDVRGTFAFTPALSLSLGVDNVFDERYFVFHPYPGRVGLLELTWTL